MNNKLLGGLMVVVIAGAIGGAVYSIRNSMRHPSQRISYPYVCDTCGAVFDVQEARKPGNWRNPPNAPSDSVIICLRCNKGWARPVTVCEECGTKHILHLCKDNRCPKCFPAAAEAAKKANLKTVYEGN